MKLEEIIETLNEWRNESAEKRSYLVFTTENKVDGGLMANTAVNGKANALITSIVKSMQEQPTLLRLIRAAVRIEEEESNQNHEEEDNE